jgi:energy-coupling factor transporter ATP-binding protein EcfA2
MIILARSTFTDPESVDSSVWKTQVVADAALCGASADNPTNKHDSDMHAPELLLENLNQSLRSLLGAATVLEDSTIAEEFRPVIQRLLLAQVLGEQDIIVIGGSQGAGKTTLLAAMYGLSCDTDAWLNANEGRGEQLPVLILEDKDVTRAVGKVRRLASDKTTGRWFLDEATVDEAAFRSACRGESADTLLPVLRVPQKYFSGSRHAMMLLPGYERATRENALWQNLMQQAMIGSSGCLIVTDRTRLANGQQQEILNDASHPDLKTLDTVVVVTKTEDLANNEIEQSKVRHTAAQTMGIDPARANDRVICAGMSNAEYRAQWLPRVAEAMRYLGSSVARNRNAQLAHLERTIGRDLGYLLATLQGRARTFLHQEGDSTLTPIARCLEEFDKASSNLRGQYREGVSDLLSRRSEEAWNSLEGRLKQNHEGIRNKVSRILDTATETQQKIRDDISGAWNAPNTPILDGVAKLIGDVVGRKLGAISVPALAQAMQDSAKASLPVRLGYVDEKQSPVAWREPSEQTLANLTALFGSAHVSNSNDASNLQTTVSLEQSVQLLPALALEYMRAASLAPVLFGMAGHDNAGMPEGDVLRSMTNVHNQMKAFGDQTSNMLKGLAFVMSIDFLADGELNAVAPLLNILGLGGASNAAAGSVTALTTVSAIGAAVATAATVGFLVHAGIREVRQYDHQVRAYGYEALQGIREQHHLHFMKSFDQLMARVRERLEEGLRRRYHVDRTLMHQDRLAKAIAEVRTHRLDLLDAIARSGKTLEIYHGVQAA